MADQNADGNRDEHLKVKNGIPCAAGRDSAALVMESRRPAAAHAEPAPALRSATPRAQKRRGLTRHARDVRREQYPVRCFSPQRQQRIIGSKRLA